MAEPYSDRKKALEALLGLPIETHSILEKRRSSPDDFSTSIPTSNPPGATVDSYASPTSTNSEDDGGHNSLSHYYFVFFAIALCAGIIGAFFLWWRRRRILLSHNRYNNAYLGRGGGAPMFPPMRRQNQPGSWFGGEQRVEEGLNEEGQAPPPYRPKGPEDAGIAGGRDRPAALREGIPLQPLPPVAYVEPGDHQPPDYEEYVQDRSTAAGPPVVR